MDEVVHDVVENCSLILLSPTEAPVDAGRAAE
jgi:hypothetical protein